MDRNQIEAEHVVERYLADQLAPAEAQAFEAYYIQHPSMVREIERVLRLKEGLATLRDRQQLEGLMRARRRQWAVPLSIAAALVATIIGLWTWRSATAPSPVAATLEELVAESKSPIPLGGKYLLVRVRGTETPVEIALPGARSALELQVLPSAGAAGAPYRLSLARLAADGDTTPAGEISGLSPGADGLVTAWLDSAQLQPGRHTVELTPERADASAPADRFVIELR